MYNYPYLTNTKFLQDFNKEKCKQQFSKITVLNWKEQPVQQITGDVISGNINMDSSSAMRRTGNISFFASKETSDVTNIDNLLSINKKIEIEIGYVNTTKQYPEYPIIWFPQGIFLINNVSITHGADGLKINLTLHDKMALLNGQCGGIIPAATVFHELETQDNYGNITISNPTIVQIIQELVHHFGNEQAGKIIIKDLDPIIKQVLKWNGDSDKPLHIYHNDLLKTTYHDVENSNQIKSFQVNKNAIKIASPLYYDIYSSIFNTCKHALNIDKEQAIPYFTYLMQAANPPIHIEQIPTLKKYLKNIKDIKNNSKNQSDILTKWRNSLTGLENELKKADFSTINNIRADLNKIRALIFNSQIFCQKVLQPDTEYINLLKQLNLKYFNFFGFADSLISEVKTLQSNYTKLKNIVSAYFIESAERPNWISQKWLTGDSINPQGQIPIPVDERNIISTLFSLPDANGSIENSRISNYDNFYTLYENQAEPKIDNGKKRKGFIFNNAVAAVQRITYTHPSSDNQRGVRLIPYGQLKNKKGYNSFPIHEISDWNVRTLSLNMLKASIDYNQHLLDYHFLLADFIKIRDVFINNNNQISFLPQAYKLKIRAIENDINQQMGKICKNITYAMIDHISYETNKENTGDYRKNSDGTFYIDKSTVLEPKPPIYQNKDNGDIAIIYYDYNNNNKKIEKIFKKTILATHVVQASTFYGEQSLDYNAHLKKYNSWKNETRYNKIITKQQTYLKVQDPNSEDYVTDDNGKKIPIYNYPNAKKSDLLGLIDNFILWCQEINNLLSEIQSYEKTYIAQIQNIKNVFTSYNDLTKATENTDENNSNFFKTQLKYLIEDMIYDTATKKYVKEKKYAIKGSYFSYLNELLLDLKNDINILPQQKETKENTHIKQFRTIGQSIYSKIEEKMQIMQGQLRDINTNNIKGYGILRIFGIDTSNPKLQDRFSAKDINDKGKAWGTILIPNFSAAFSRTVTNKDQSPTKVQQTFGYNVLDFYLNHRGDPITNNDAIFTDFNNPYIVNSEKTLQQNIRNNLQAIADALQNLDILQTTYINNIIKGLQKYITNTNFGQLNNKLPDKISNLINKKIIFKQEGSSSLDIDFVKIYDKFDTINDINQFAEIFLQNENKLFSVIDRTNILENITEEFKTTTEINTEEIEKLSFLQLNEYLDYYYQKCFELLYFIDNNLYNFFTSIKDTDNWINTLNKNKNYPKNKNNQNKPQITDSYKQVVLSKFFIQEINKIQTAQAGEDIGYTLTDFTYPGKLEAKAGDTVVSVLDKIKNTLGNFEYFYDVNGNFIFQEIKNYLNKSYSSYKLAENQSPNYNYNKIDGRIVYNFENNEIIQSYSNNPQYSSIKNDFLVWGERKSTDGKKYPIRYHLAIDTKPSTGTVYCFNYPILDEYNKKDKVPNANQKVIDNSNQYKYLSDLPKEGEVNIYYYVRSENQFYEWKNENGSTFFGYQLITPPLQHIIQFSTFENFMDFIKTEKTEKQKLKFTNQKIQQLLKDSFYFTNKNGDTSYYHSHMWYYIHNIDEYFYLQIVNKNNIISYKVQHQDFPRIKKCINFSYKDRDKITKPQFYGFYRNIDSNNKNKIYRYQPKDINTGISSRWIDQAYIVPFFSNDYRMELFLDGAINESTGLKYNDYYTELKTEWPKLFNIFPIKITDQTTLSSSNYYSIIKNNPTNMDYFLDFLSNSELITKYGISNIGKRTKVISNNNINCIFEPICPNIVYIDKNPPVNLNQSIQQQYNEQIHLQQEKNKLNKAISEWNKKNYFSSFDIKIEVNHDVYEKMINGGTARSAYEEIRAALYEYLTYNEQLTLTTLPVYNLEPNQIINVNNEEAHISGEYLIKSLSFSLGTDSTMNISCSKVIRKI